MAKIAFLGAGSTIFAKNILGDCMHAPALRDAHMALYDIDGQRLEDSQLVLGAINRNTNDGRATITAHLGPEQRREALAGADYVVNAIQVGGYQPSTEIDFEVPKKHGLRQTIGDTLGIGGLFRALRTFPVMLAFARDMEEVCPDAQFLNYVNPMAILTAGMNRHTGIDTVGLCHSVQSCVPGLLRALEMEPPSKLAWRIGGINHMAWLTEIRDGDTDLYPEIRRRAVEKNDRCLENGETHGDMVRFEILRHFGYYVTESSEHNAEYTPYWIKAQQPELIERFGIPLDEYPRRCVKQIADWNEQRDAVVADPTITHDERSHEYGSYIMEAMETNEPFTFHGNVTNRGGLIENLPNNACVEVPCVADRNGVTPCRFGSLPEQLAGLNRTNVNMQLMALEAAMSGRRDHVYQAAALDPLTGSELSLDRIRALCDDLIEAHGDDLPQFAGKPALVGAAGV